MAILHTSQHHEPWSREKLMDQKAPLKLKASGLFRSDFSLVTRSGTPAFAQKQTLINT